MKSKPVKKSALDWLRANVTSLPASPFALQPEPAALASAPLEQKVPPQQQPPEPPPVKPKLLPAAVEVWLELVAGPDYQVPAWAALARSGDRRGIVVTLNAGHQLVAKALRERDDVALAFLAALPLAEILIRRRREPFVAAALERIRNILVPEEQRQISGWLFLSEVLAASPQFRAAAVELAGGVLMQPYLVFNVRLDG
jgi:hypothetical protein